MNRINQLFSSKKENILSIYFCAGHPTLDGTVNTIEQLEKKGIDMIEIGIPFSDPMADGPVIQDAATKALRNGMSLRLLFSQLKDIRKSVNIPLVLMGYLNPIYQYGLEKFFADCATIGIDGVIIPDLPFKDYQETVKPIADKNDVRTIMLINERRPHPLHRREHKRIHLHGFVGCHNGRAEGVRRLKAGLLQQGQCNEPEKSANDWLRH